MNIFKDKLYNCGNILENNKLVNWQPRIYATVINKFNLQESELAVNFLIDTGASMTILQSNLKDLFNGTKRIDVLKMYYGNGPEKNLNVYEIKIRIKGEEFNIQAALDEEFTHNYSLLGVTKGLDQFYHNVFNFKKRNYLLTYK
jgi:predicted aspartyl protease